MRRIAKGAVGILFSLMLPVLAHAATADVIVQPGRNLAVGSFGTSRGTQDGSLGNQETHAKYQQAVRDGNVYICVSTGVTTTQAGLSGTNAPLTLWNPVGSGKSLVLIEDQISLNAAPAAATIFSLAASTVAPSGTTLSNTIVNALLNPANFVTKAAPIGQCYASSTVNNPTFVRFLGGVTGASSLTPATFTDVVDGRIVLGPGTAITFNSSAAAAIFGQYIWEEIPYP